MYNKTIIIAHYNENLERIKPLTNFNIAVYTKGHLDKSQFKDYVNIKIFALPNIGNEQHTYYYHIVNNYNELKGDLIFTQAGPFEHCKYFYDKIDNDVIGGISDFNFITSYLGDIPSGNFHKHINHHYASNLNYEQVFDKIFIDPRNNQEAIQNIQYIFNNLKEIEQPKFNWYWNGNGLYKTNSDKIFKYNINFYEKCLSLFDNFEYKMTAFAFERISNLILI